MRKKILALFLLAWFFNQSLNAQVRDTLPAFITYSYIPVLKWNVTSLNHLTTPSGDKYYRERYLDYTFNHNALSSIEGNFGIKRIGLRMGVSVNMDNNLIGKASKYPPYLDAFPMRLLSIFTETPIRSPIRFMPKFPSMEERAL